MSEIDQYELRQETEAFPMRLQKFLARAGVSSRRGAEGLITAGRVEVNGVVITELGRRVDPLADVVQVDGVVVVWGKPHVVLMLNKPAGIITTMNDFRGRRCVADIMPTDRYPGLYPIGRLDRDTTGLLLFSTDGELGNNLLHPSRHVDKTYLAWVEGLVTPGQVEKLSRGVVLEDGPTAPAVVEIVKTRKGRTLLSLTIHEGRKHQVKRMCAHVGHPVVHLQRVSFGPLALGDLPQGLFRELTPAETEALYCAANMDLSQSNATMAEG